MLSYPELKVAWAARCGAGTGVAGNGPDAPSSCWQEPSKESPSNNPEKAVFLSGARCPNDLETNTAGRSPGLWAQHRVDTLRCSGFESRHGCGRAHVEWTGNCLGFEGTR